MFVRKRTYRTKKGRVGESYQVLETYRENGGVKQRVVCRLGRYPTPEQALEVVRRLLKVAEDIAKQPVKPYSGLLRVRTRSLKEIKRIEAERLQRFEKLKAWVAKLEYVVSKKCNMSYKNDTTNHKEF
jgi:hypothetical protein